MKLSRRTVLITGGTSGIGLELARQLLTRGNTVVATGRDAARLDAARQGLPDLHVVRSDVADPDEIAWLHEHVLSTFPALDVLVNNAGIMRNLDLRAPRDLADVTREIEVCLSGPVRMVQQFLPDLRTRDEALVVNVTSGIAFVPFPVSPVYSAAKAALHAYTRCLREQLRGSNVRVVELAPPPVETPLLRGEFAAEMAGEKGMSAEALVRRAIAGIEAGRLEIRPGVSNVLKVASRVAPGPMFAQMAKLGRPNGKGTAPRRGTP